MNSDLRTAIEAALGDRILGVTAVTGGDINDAWRVDTPQGLRFAKTKRDDHTPIDLGFFSLEAEGLEALRRAEGPRIPEVIAVDADFLLLEWIEAGPEDATADEAFGRALARLHERAYERWGGRDNYIGFLQQDNRPAESAAVFWRTRRLAPLLGRSEVARHFDDDDHRAFGRLFENLEDLIGPATEASLLHGDLWSGNRLTDVQGTPVLFDPAAYAGHSEIDLAMMRLFGGFSERVFTAYEAQRPPLPGAAERVALWQLYPLLVHVCLFGGGYAPAVRRALARLV